MSRVVVFGASGFVGRAVCLALRDAGHEAVAVKAPRLPPLPEERVRAAIDGWAGRPALSECLEDADAVVNAAGDPRATATDEHALLAANAALPGLIASVVAGARPDTRFVHVSSAAAQGDVAVLDGTPAHRGSAPSAYSRSKALGEELALHYHPGSVVYRPVGVHAADRPVTRQIARLARSPLSTVTRPGDRPTAQTLLPNVASAVAFLATTQGRPPTIVSHPFEGLTTTALLTALGGRPPRQLPHALGRAVVMGMACSERVLPGLAGHRRRLEMLWFGQRQAASWLTEAGWSPPFGRQGWDDLGRHLSGPAQST